MLRVLFLLPVGLFITVSITMNTLFAWSLGANEIVSWCWVALGVGAALFAGLGPDLVRVNIQRRAYDRALAAGMLLLIALAYDGLSAYGFAVREHHAAQDKARNGALPRVEALRRRDTAQAALRPYADAPDAASQSEIVQGLARLVDARKCTWAEKPQPVKEACEKLSTAETNLARAKARERLAVELEEAERALARIPEPPPADARADTFGENVVAWLPVALLQLGTLLGAFAAWVPHKAKPVKASTPPAADMEPVREALDLGPSPSVVKLAAALAAQPGPPPPGLRVDQAGWIRGTQRDIAKAAKVPLATVNRELRAAVASGALEVDTSNNQTAFRIGATGRA